MARIRTAGQDPPDEVLGQILRQRFSTTANECLIRARDEAAQRGRHEISIEHLLLAVQRVDEPLFVDDAGVRVRLSEEDLRLTPQTTVSLRATESIPFSSDIKAVIQDAAGEASDLGHTAVQPPHLLLAILDQNTTWASQVLSSRGVTRQRIVDAIRRRSAGE